MDGLSTMNVGDKLICNVKGHSDLGYIRKNEMVIALECSLCKQRWRFKSLEDAANIPVDWDVRYAAGAALAKGDLKWPV